MSLSSSLFSGISGLSTLGNAMQIIGDNIANVNTVAFKQSSFTFQDLLSQSINTMSGTCQVGRGTALGDIRYSFAQGSFETTPNATDLAIGGNGFFQLREAGTQNFYYSRAGNFSFDEEGYLVNPEGKIVQGWAMDSNGEDEGSITDIVMSSFTSPPLATNNIEIIVNLDSEGSDNSSGTDTSLFQAWNGTNVTPLGENAYEYQTTQLVYDSLGSTHDITLYFDKAESASTYEYIVTCNPSEDNRTFAATPEVTDVTCLAKASISNGDYFTISSINGDYYVWYDTDGGATDPAVSGKTGIEVTITPDTTADEVATSTAAAIAAGADFGASAASAVVTITNAHDGAVTNADASTSGFTTQVTAQGGTAASHPLVGLLANGTITFNTSGTMIGMTLGQIDTSDGSIDLQTTSDVSDGYYQFQANFISGNAQNMEINFGRRYNGAEWTNKSLSTKQYAAASTTTFKAANGYGAGDLGGVTVDLDGVITGSYSNGQLIPLYRVGLAKFQNEEGLFKEGGNLYSQTRESGDVITNKPRTNGLGSITPNALEQSNVDIAHELVKMITTQRGFQANSKIITVTDQMLQELINIKR